MKQLEGLITEEETPDEFTQWKAARQYAALIGDPPRFIRATIHFLRLDVEENNNELSFRAKSCLLPLLRSAEFRAVLYYAAKTFFPKRLQGVSLDNPRKFATLFRPKEFIAIISVMYLYRRMKKGCHKESFQNFVKNVSHDWILAGGIGRAIHRIGFADGLILGSFPQLAQCLFLGVDKKNFKNYRVSVRLQNKGFDLPFELKHWKCNCLQIAVLLAQYLGLGRHYHDPFMIGLAAKDLDEVATNDTWYGARLIEVWRQSLKTSDEAPDMPHRGEFYPFASEMVWLSNFSRTIKSFDVEDLFFEKGKEDLSEESTPEVFTAGPPPGETSVSTIADLPEEIRDEFSDDIDLDEVLS